ncbi:MAG TPA: Gfo/Idh/MocA family oxidoreductase [Opitutaceae bacterium]|nr:Gfo/Idh/MocA family oxidoreductase [Opitutaceae bacterium]
MSTAHPTPQNSLSRRQFVSRVAIGTAALAWPLIVPSRLRGAAAPSNRLRLGQIGCGRIARVHDMPAIIKANLGDYVAVCDLDGKRVQDALALLKELTASQSSPAPDARGYRDYRELLARPDIDAVVISTPDHWHAELAVAAILAGKDVYLQKPMTMTFAESVILRDVVAKSGRVFQLGSQQRSTEQFRLACELVRSGRVGRLQRVEIGLPVDPTAPDQPEQPVPKQFDYERWLGPTADVYYTEQRVHPQNDYSRPGWLRNDAYCLGMITGWGAHHFDIAHWGMDVEMSGPLKIEGTAEFPKNKIWNVHGAYRVELTYPRDIRLTVSDKFENGIKFIGDEGWIFVSRGEAKSTPSDPSPAVASKKLDASDARLLDPAGLTVQLPRSAEHHLNFLQCVRSNQTPMSPAPIAQRSNAACIVSWIAMKLQRPLRWDPVAERFENDDEANRMLTRPERAPYGAHHLLQKT